MFYLAPKKSKRGTELKIRKYQNHTNHEMKEVFVGDRTVFSVIGLTVGAILVGRSLWEYGTMYIGLPLTLLGGFMVFIISGLILKQFRG